MSLQQVLYFDVGIIIVSYALFAPDGIQGPPNHASLKLHQLMRRLDCVIGADSIVLSTMLINCICLGAPAVPGYEQR